MSSYTVPRSIPSPATSIKNSALPSPPPVPESRFQPSPAPPTTTASPAPSLSQPPATPSRPAFSPFFTLISSSSTSGAEPSSPTTHHPSNVHYIFSDDDASDLLSSACVRALSQPSSHQSSSSPLDSSSSSSSTYRKRPSSPTYPDPAYLPPREERVVILDINETGDRVLKASSLSQKWQVINAAIEKAPTWDGGSPDSPTDGSNTGMMLRVDGVEAAVPGRSGASSMRRERGGSLGKRDLIGSMGGGTGEDEMAKLLSSFDQKMNILRNVLGAGKVGELEVEGDRAEGSASNQES